MAIRVYLAGPVSVENGDAVVREPDLGGRQSRLLLASLACADGRPVPKDELAELLWPGDTPPSWDVSVAALVSKLRSALARADLPRDAIDGALGCYQLRLGPDAWVDVLAVGANLYQAEGALLRGAPAEAMPHALIACTVTRRPFLAEEHGTWVEGTRARLREQRLRALEIFAEALLAAGDHARAVGAASDVLELDPYHETGYQLLMRAHALVGNRAEALRVYERCRKLLSAELGVDPSATTEKVYLDILRG